MRESPRTRHLGAYIGYTNNKKIYLLNPYPAYYNKMSGWCQRWVMVGGWNTINGVLESECQMGESCFADTPCDRNIAPVPVPDLPSLPTSAPTQFCGSSLADAQSQY
jgi:hypothetical protein